MPKAVCVPASASQWTNITNIFSSIPRDCPKPPPRRGFRHSIICANTAFHVEPSIYEINKTPLKEEKLKGTETDPKTGAIRKAVKTIAVEVDGKAVEGFPAPSGKNEFFSQTMVDWKWPEYAIPTYIFWSDGGVHQNITFPVHPDPISGMHCWHQKVRIEKARPEDEYGDIFVDTNKSMAVYREWLKMARPAPGPDGLRRPLWMKRALRPAEEMFYMR